MTMDFFFSLISKLVHSPMVSSNWISIQTMVCVMTLLVLCASPATAPTAPFGCWYRVFSISSGGGGLGTMESFISSAWTAILTDFLVCVVVMGWLEFPFTAIPWVAWENKRAMVLLISGAKGNEL